MIQIPTWRRGWIVLPPQSLISNDISNPPELRLLGTGAYVEEGLDWSATPLPHEKHTWRRPHNKALSALLTLRGSGAATADTHSFADPALYPSWQVCTLNTCPSHCLIAGCSPAQTTLADSHDWQHARASSGPHSAWLRGILNIVVCIFTAGICSFMEPLLHLYWQVLLIPDECISLCAALPNYCAIAIYHQQGCACEKHMTRLDQAPLIC